MTDPQVKFENPKLERQANWLVKQFARTGALEYQLTTQDQIELLKKRGLEKQYRGSKNNIIFPTNEGWTAFYEFIDLIYKAHPYIEKATFSEVFNAYGTALADLISAGSFPENYNDLFEYLPNRFIKSLKRFENCFHKLEGLIFKEDWFLRVGQTWIGKFSNLSLDNLTEKEHAFNEKNFETLKQVFEDQTPVISGGRIYATSDHTYQEDSFRTDIGLGILAILLNMTYRNTFSRLSVIRRIERPEQGISKHFSFGLAGNEGTSAHTLRLSTKFTGAAFEVDDSIVAYWQESLLLAEINQITAMPPELRTELQAKLLKAILYFRQASLQKIPEMQISTLWVCVECLLTVGDEAVLKSNIPTLLAISDWLLPPDLWPENAQNLDQLESILKRYYRSRSKTFHYGSIGHVTNLEVQQFSMVVCNLIVAVTHLGTRGYNTTKSMLRASRSLLARAKPSR